MSVDTATPGAASLPTVFAALGDDTRWSILVRLGSAPASASALTRELPISRQAVARHLEVLRAAGLVEAERYGRELRYRALGARVSDAARSLEQLAGRWDARLADIKAAAEAPPARE